MNVSLVKLANHLYHGAPRIYRALYRVYKVWSDRTEREILARILKPGMTALDVGANIGIYTQFIADRVGRSGRVVAFEPEQCNFERLRMATRDLPQVEVVHSGVSDHSGVLHLYVADDLNVDHHTYASSDGRRSVDVPGIALDDFIKADEQVDLIKMDIQGAEFSAVRGARRLLSGKSGPTLLMEYWPYGLRAAGEDPRALLVELEAMGYSLTTVGNVPLPDAVGGGQTDYVNVLASKMNSSS